MPVVHGTSTPTIIWFQAGLGSANPMIRRRSCRYNSASKKQSISLPRSTWTTRADHRVFRGCDLYREIRQQFECSSLGCPRGESSEWSASSICTTGKDGRLGRSRKPWHMKRSTPHAKQAGTPEPTLHRQRSSFLTEGHIALDYQYSAASLFCARLLCLVWPLEFLATLLQTKLGFSRAASQSSKGLFTERRLRSDVSAQASACIQADVRHALDSMFGQVRSSTQKD